MLLKSFEDSKKLPMKAVVFIAITLLAFSLVQQSCQKTAVEPTAIASKPKPFVGKKTGQVYFVAARDVDQKHYLKYIDGLVAQINGIWEDYLDEYDLVRNNPQLIDRLANTDYYYLKELGMVVQNLDTIRIIEAGDTLFVPNRNELAILDSLRNGTRLEVNIPEFRLRILQLDSLLFEFPIRVGRDQEKFLAMADQNVDLKTRTGEGFIVRVNKEPLFINPADNHRYERTIRDDGISTTLPRVPWLIPSICGIEHGQLIHPTTNRVTLGKAYSNGCLGTREADAWYIYYYAPPGTPIRISYQLQRITPEGDTLNFPDVYKRSR